MIPTFRELLDSIGTMLREQGGLGLVMLDLAPLARVERSFGGAAYQAVRAQLEPLVAEMRQSIRQDDVVARHEAEGDRFLLFLGARREKSRPFAASDLRTLADRLEGDLAPRLARLTQPYFRDRPVIEAGYAFLVHSPLESPERQILRLIDETIASAELRRRLLDREQRERLQEIIFNQQVWTVFQDIVEMQSQETLGYEALSRGPRGTPLQPPVAMFGAAGRYGLVEELERACRRQTFRDWERLGRPGRRLFMNTVPATIRDPTFLGRGVLDHLGSQLSPRLVTLEITEREVIDNLNLYREAMHAFLDLGFSFAIDDLGAGYSGLEIVATLHPSYLKIDMGLVRDIHLKRVNQGVVKAILDVGAGVGATVIAEGIETVEERDALVDLGVRFGQGYLYGRPIDPSAPRTGGPPATT